MPAWTKLAWQDPISNLFDAVFWNPEQPYEFKSQSPKQAETLRIYEAHIGMVRRISRYLMISLHIFLILNRAQRRARYLHTSSSRTTFSRGSGNWATTAFSLWLFRSMPTTHLSDIMSRASSRPPHAVGHQRSSSILLIRHMG